MIGRVHGPDEGLRCLDALPAPDFQPAWATRAWLEQPTTNPAQELAAMSRAVNAQVSQATQVSKTTLVNQATQVSHATQVN